MLQGEAYVPKCTNAWMHYISESAHMCGCDTKAHTHTQGHLHTSPRGQDHNEEEILPFGSTTEERG